MLALVAATCMAATPVAQARVDGDGQPSERPEARAAIGPVLVAVIVVGTRVAAKAGPKVVRALRRGRRATARARARGRRAIRRIIRWARKFRVRRGLTRRQIKRAALRAFVRLRLMPKVVVGCAFGFIGARLRGGGIVSMAVGCLKGIILVAAGRDPLADMRDFLFKRDPAAALARPG